MQDGYDVLCSVTVKDVIEAVCRLEPWKYDGCMGLSSDHVRHACDEWYIHVSMLLTALTLSMSTILPIYTKGKGKSLNYSDSTNYRGIALRSILGKIYDAYVLNRYIRWPACLVEFAVRLQSWTFNVYVHNDT
jgi:hypothetical protein